MTTLLSDTRFGENRLIVLPKPLFAHSGRAVSCFEVENLVFQEEYRSIEGVGTSVSDARDLIESLKIVGEELSFLHIPSILTIPLSNLQLSWLSESLNTLTPDSSYSRMYSNTLLGILKGSLLYIHGRMKEKFLSENDIQVIIYEAVFLFLFYGLKMQLLSHWGVPHRLSVFEMMKQFTKFAGRNADTNDNALAYYFFLSLNLKKMLETLAYQHRKQDVYHLLMVFSESEGRAIDRIPSDLRRYIASYLMDEEEDFIEIE